MLHEFAKWLAIPAILVLLAATPGCGSKEIRMEVPDMLSGAIEDDANGARIEGVSVGLDIREWDHVAFIGPEGTTRPKVRASRGVRTSIDGLFYIDLRTLKMHLNTEHPGEKFAIEGLFIRKEGYFPIVEKYNGPGQVFRLKKK